MLNNKKFFRYSLVGILLIRLLLNAILPLMDKTEARYAEIARIMYETNNWITPQIDYGVPFWAKPPLNTWLSALSMKVFGVNEFAVRFPAFLLCLLIVFIVSKAVKEKGLGLFISAFVMFTLPQFLLHAGVVSTDTSLLLAITLIMIGFWKQINEPKKNIWGYLMFVGVGIGLLAKGPIAIILTGPPVFIWVVWFKQWKNLFTRIPWLIGIPIMLLIAVPWYILAEQKTEGFLDYFIVGEHFKRFVDSSWKGDKYGFPKQQPLGIVWLFLLGMALPWFQVVIGNLWKNRSVAIKDKWVFFLVAWMVWTPLFFTVSKSLIHTYVLPVMPPIALLVVHYWDAIKRKKTNVIISLILPSLAAIALVVGLFNNNLEKYSNTDKYLIESVGELNKPLYYLGKKSYSSQFYSRGKVETISYEELHNKIVQGEAFYVIIKNKTLKRNPEYSIEGLSSEHQSMKNTIYSSN
ncbi:ArnT family glycosyltransferase [Plebeiibacterium sediminum]|uniref:Glycosyltransferase family 39 protein n=1 Tax=Plebeiibacterium sediminum TaxID=2992112 RepID=A0AAE3M580_9BACT|nr:glycosyltransferase family 39 protein [Plebeiobacterium sediminum]MCW3787055.1 glycosyltransferase family 39 protein [Plebeiobacterium sediminum]